MSCSSLMVHLDLGQTNEAVLHVTAALAIGWNDTREARRTLADAPPILKLAGHVTVFQIAAEADLKIVNEQLQDVVACSSPAPTVTAVCANGRWAAQRSTSC